MSVRGSLFLEVAEGCRTGATWDPASAARLQDRAQADDGRLAAVVLQPVNAHEAFQVHVSQPGHRSYTVTVDLDKPAS